MKKGNIPLLQPPLCEHQVITVLLSARLTTHMVKLQTMAALVLLLQGWLHQLVINE